MNKYTKMSECIFAAIIVLLWCAPGFGMRAELDSLGYLYSPSVEVVTVGTIQGLVGKDQSVVSGSSLTNFEAIAKMWPNICYSNRCESDIGREKEYLLYKVKTHLVLRGLAEQGITEVSCSVPFSRVLEDNSSYIMLMTRRHKSFSLVSCWEIPSIYAKTRLYGLSDGNLGVNELVRRLIMDPDYSVSARAAVMSSRIGDFAALSLIRYRFVRARLEQNGVAEETMVRYVTALLNLRDTVTLADCVDWLVAHPDAARGEKPLNLYLRFLATPFEEENGLIIASLQRLASAGLGIFSRAADSNLKTYEKRKQLGLSLYPGDERGLLDKVSQDLKAIRLGCLERERLTKTDATQEVTPAMIAPYMENGFPDAPRGGEYEIGFPGHFPRYIPPLGMGWDVPWTGGGWLKEEKCRYEESFTYGGKAEVITVGIVDGLVSKKGEVLKNLGWIAAFTNSQVYQTKLDSRGNTVQGFLYRIKVRKMFRGSVKSNTIDVFIRAPGTFLESSRAYVLLLQNDSFGKGVYGVVAPEECQGTWRVPKVYIAPEMLSDISEDSRGLNTLLQRMIDDPDWCFSATAAMVAADIGDASFVSFVRQKIQECRDLPYELNPQIMGMYIHSLCIMGDFQVLVMHADWLIKHAEVCRKLGIPRHKLPFGITKLAVDSKQLSQALTKLAGEDIGWLQQEAANALKTP